MKTAISSQPSAVSSPDLAQAQMVPISSLRAAAWNARKTVDLAALADLTDSIRQHGVLVPLIVRPLDVMRDIMHNPEAAAKGGQAYEIIAGHRRFKAAAIVKVAGLPCLVREMDDALAREIALVDNLQREDLPALEEAEGFGQLMAEPGADLESVAAKLGKSASYVGRRLKLLDAIAPVREALKAGSIEVGHAMELARLDGRLQEELLECLDVGYCAPEGAGADDDDDEEEVPTCRYCNCDEDNACQLDSDEGACSWADASKTVCTNPECLAAWRADGGQEGPGWRKTDRGLGYLKKEIGRRALKDLSAAPFALDSAELGAVACSACPKRSINQALLFNDLAGSDVCTDRACYDRKCNAFVQIELDAAVADKRKLLQLADGWTNKKGVLAGYDVRVLASASECVSGEEAIYVEGNKVGTHVTICRDKNCKKHRGSRSSYGGGSRKDATPAEKEEHKAERKKILDKVRAETAYRRALAVAIAAAPVPAPELPGLIADVCVAVINGCNSLYGAKLAGALGWDEKFFHHAGAKQLKDKLAGLATGQQLVTALLSEEADELGVQEYSLGGKPEGLEKLARRLGVDLVMVRTGTPTKPEQKPAAKAAKPAKSKPKKAVLGAATRKRIAAAQKKRWAAAAKSTKPAKKKGGR